MEVAEAEILQAIDGLKELGLVSEVSGSRVVRFGHHIEKGLGIPTQASALLTVLLLRGPQTAGELRLNCERLHKFADISSVEAFLEELAERDAGALVVEMPRLPGARENRWMHLLSGPVAMEVGGKPVATPALVQLQARVDVLESEVASLRAMLDELLGR
jgi:uncharacterized protein YceH (UPF0502 family)